MDVNRVPYQKENTPLKNSDLGHVSQFVGEILAQYGWYLLILSVLVYLLIEHLSKRISRWRSYTALQDAALVAKRQEAMELARRRMQEELDAKAAMIKEKQEQQEEEKRRQKIEIWDSMQQGKSYKGSAKLSQTPEEDSSSTTVLKPKTAKKTLRRNDYSPLTGQGGGSCSWRPGRRGPSSGG
ncbi:selenoprotein S-like isoform X1 [Channa argus]|uniref:selenoprotein S-like isoform X1 n=1 Tax=Channa argus TaxID=215402 RepID=UPI0035205F78